MLMKLTPGDNPRRKFVGNPVNEIKSLKVLNNEQFLENLHNIIIQ